MGFFGRFCHTDHDLDTIAQGGNLAQSRHIYVRCCNCTSQGCAVVPIRYQCAFAAPLARLVIGKPALTGPAMGKPPTPLAAIEPGSALVALSQPGSEQQRQQSIEETLLHCSKRLCCNNQGVNRP
jgi:hypothetical protein